ncbi:MAG: hypothetical protein ABWZ75_08640 [Novosphingobium sp.]
MIVHPEIGSLRGDDTPQRIAQDAMHDAIGAWRDRPGVAEVIADVAAFASGMAMADCAGLARLFDESDYAAVFARDFCAAACTQLELSPLARVPQRHFHDDAISTLLIAQAGNVTLSLVAIDGEGLRGRPAAKSASFWPGEAWEAVLVGTARAKLVECRSRRDDGAQLCHLQTTLQPGKVICRDASRQALVVRDVHGCLVSLRLQRRGARAGVTREFALEDGRLLHQAAGNPRDSRIELMMAALGRMGRTDAAPIFAEIAAGEGAEALRWQALRECLALDTLTGFTTLTTIARNDSDALSGPAEGLRSQLVRAYPQLAGIE